VFYIEHGEFDKATERFQYEIDHPDGGSKKFWAEIHYKLAMAWLQAPYKNGNLVIDEMDRTLSSPHIPEAIGELGKALQADPDFYWAHTVLAFIYFHQGNDQMARFHEKQIKDILQKQGNPSP